MTKHSHFPYMSSTPHNTNRKHNIHHIHYTNTQILQHSKAKTLFLTMATTQQTFPQTPPHTVTTTDIKTNMHHIHTSIVSRHLDTRGNNKILRAPPPHISNSEERLPRLTRRTLAQLRTNKSPSLKSYLHKVDATSITTMPPLQPQHTPSLQMHPHTHHTVTPGFVDRHRWSDGAAGQMERYTGWWTKSGMIGLPPHKQGSG